MHTRHDPANAPDDFGRVVTQVHKVYTRRDVVLEAQRASTGYVSDAI